MKQLRLLIVLLAINAVTPVVAQTDIEDKDFVYLMPSKEIAETGEDLWFKTYLLNSKTLAPSLRSQTLYLQVRSHSDSIVWNEKYLLEDGRGDGHIYVGTDWPLGEYYIEGYTRSSFTTDSTQCMHPRRILVVDRVTQMDSISKVALDNDSLQKKSAKHRFDLFPEGGNLIYGVNSVVAFKATYGDGVPEEVTGKVFENGHKIANIKTLHDGMGMFVVKPRAGKEYRVQLSDGRTIPFPEIKTKGISMSVSRNNSKGITIIVSASDSITHQFAISAKLHGVECCNAKGAIKKQQIVFLPINYFTNQGIAEITLEDGLGFPIAERLVYVNPELRLNIAASDVKQHYNRREMDTIRLKVTDMSGKPVRAELAVSIFDKAYLFLPGHENILSHCYLSQQIRGNIYNPTYYFDEQNADRQQALDLLLLTQGWRRFVYNDKSIEDHPLLTDGINGLLTTQREVSLKTQVLKVFSPQGDTCVILTDSSGRFEINPQMMANMPGNIYLCHLLTERYKANISAVNMFDTINEYRSSFPRYGVNNRFVKAYNGFRMVFDEKAILLNEVVVTDQRGNTYREKEQGFLDSLAVLQSGEWVCDCDPDMPYLNDYHGYSHHPKWSPQEEFYHGERRIPKRGEIYQLIEIKETCVKPGHNGHELLSLEKYKSSTFKPTRASRTQRSDLIFWLPNGEPRRGFVYPGPQYSEAQLLEKYGICKTQGYYPKREFYQPNAAVLASSVNDARNLLLWKPSVITNEDGIVEIPFSTSDINTEFIGIVEAIDGNGLMGYQMFNFRVIKK